MSTKRGKSIHTKIYLNLLEVKELESYTFKPNINKKSKQITHNPKENKENKVDISNFKN